MASEADICLSRAFSQNKEQKAGETEHYDAQLEQLGPQIESVQDFWRYNNNTPVENIKMRESIYLFKAGFKPIWEDRRNINGGSWTFRVPKNTGPDVWTRVQLMAIGEKLQSALDESTFCPAPSPTSVPCPASVDVPLKPKPSQPSLTSKQATSSAVLDCLSASIPT